ncbi:MAG TPA: 23S rRNA pseudouridine(955/2504/2580) synthase RluC, partial [Gammaproteobacteria bacterium]|nr:23S rRNA pseudouridine(955/2504/2580) synthase RluC [Gammaproteobacteria bacterium]
MNKPVKEETTATLPQTRVRHVAAGEDDAGQRLDNFLLRHLKGVPKSRVYRLLRKGEVRVNKKRAKPDYRLEAGDEVRLPPVRQAAEKAPVDINNADGLLGRLAAAIIYEDDRLLVVNKPAGLAVHGGSGLDFGLIEALRRLRPDAPALDLIHRLDRDTSGCLLVAKRRSMLRAMHALLREGQVEKQYLALVQGKWRGGKITQALEKNQMQSGERMVKASATGKASTSLFTPEQRFTDTTLMKVVIPTGRTHQIRVHAANAGHPVLGDDKYGDRAANKAIRKTGLKRMFLHAAQLSFIHPVSGEQLILEAPLPVELTSVLNKLKNVRHFREGGNPPATKMDSRLRGNDEELL